MKKLLYSIGLLGALFPAVTRGQSSDLERFNARRLQNNRVGMTVLGAWALGNMAASGAILLNGTEGSATHRHRMNIYWNVVNLGLAGAGLWQALRARPEALTLRESVRSHYRLQKILLFNAGLDVGYMVGGFYLLERAKNDAENAAQWRGFGRSLLLQGGFLLVFDAALYLLHQRNGNRRLLPLIGPGGAGAALRF